MDTDNLSRETYGAVIVEAESLTHDLTLQFATLSSRCQNEDEYLQRSKQLIAEILEYDDFDLEDFFFGLVPNRKEMIETLDKIVCNIEKVKKIPKSELTYEF